MISMDKKYRTRSGLPVRVLCVDRVVGDYPVVALVTEKDQEGLYSYTITGRYVAGGTGPVDLIEVVPAKYRIVGGYPYVSVYLNAIETATTLGHYRETCGVIGILKYQDDKVTFLSVEEFLNA